MGLIFHDFNPSLALSAILECDGEKITTRTKPDPAPYLNLEAVAQTCGLHLRHRHGFTVRAFLVSVSNLTYPAGQMQTGWTIHARLTAETQSGARYDVQIINGPSCSVVIGRQDLGGTSVDTFFRNKFQWLCTRSSAI